MKTDLEQYKHLHGKLVILPDAGRVRVEWTPEKVYLKAIESDPRGADFIRLVGVVYADDAKESESAAIASLIWGDRLSKYKTIEKESRLPSARELAEKYGIPPCTRENYRRKVKMIAMRMRGGY